MSHLKFNKNPCPMSLSFKTLSHFTSVSKESLYHHVEYEGQGQGGTYTMGEVLCVGGGGRVKGGVLLFFRYLNR